MSSNGQDCQSNQQSADELSVLAAEEIESLLSEPWEGQKEEPQSHSELGAGGTDICSSSSEVLDFPPANIYLLESKSAFLINYHPS